MEYLRSITEVWRKEIRKAREHKHSRFGKTARRLWDFMGKQYRDLYIESTDPDFSFPSADEDTPYYKPRTNKTREFVNTVLPWVCAKVPNRVVTPSRPPLPAEVLQLAGLGQEYLQASLEDRTLAWLLQWWLSYTATEVNAKRQQRIIAQEALVKGRGVGWHELVPGPSGMIPGTFYDSVDNLLIDPGHSQWRDLSYVIRRRRWPCWQLAEYWGVPVEEVRAARKSGVERAAEDGDHGDPATGLSEEGDECIWYEIYSRMGIGQKLYHSDDEMKARAEGLEALGRHVYLAILPGLEYPLNLPRRVFGAITPEELKARLEWPVAFFEAPDNPFPCTPMDIYPDTESAWATSPLEGTLPLQVFLDHCYAFLFSRVRTTSRDIIITAKVLEQKVQDAIAGALDQTVLSAEGMPGEEIDKLVHVLKFPEMNRDLWQVMAYAERAFEAGSGMDPLLGGHEGARQIRSAEEAGIRQANVSNRPNDYADAVEDFNSAAAAKESQMARLYVEPQTVAPLFREPVVEDWQQFGPLTLWWASLVNTQDPREAAGDLHYTVEAGSGRRKNRQKQMADLQAVGQLTLPVIQQFAVAGIPEPFNGFMDLMAETYEMPLDRVKLPAVNLTPPEEKESSSSSKSGSKK